MSTVKNTVFSQAAAKRIEAVDQSNSVALSFAVNSRQRTKNQNG
jgi:hypothetical protein